MTSSVLSQLLLLVHPLPTPLPCCRSDEYSMLTRLSPGTEWSIAIKSAPYMDSKGVLLLWSGGSLPALEIRLICAVAHSFSARIPINSEPETQGCFLLFRDGMASETIQLHVVFLFSSISLFPDEKTVRCESCQAMPSVREEGCQVTPRASCEGECQVSPEAPSLADFAAQTPPWPSSTTVMSIMEDTLKRRFNLHKSPSKKALSHATSGNRKANQSANPIPERNIRKAITSSNKPFVDSSPLNASVAPKSPSTSSSSSSFRESESTSTSSASSASNSNSTSASSESKSSPSGTSSQSTSTKPAAHLSPTSLYLQQLRERILHEKQQASSSNIVQ